MLPFGHITIFGEKQLHQGRGAADRGRYRQAAGAVRAPTLSLTAAHSDAFRALVQPHVAGNINWSREINDADQFDNGVIGEDRRFGCGRRNEVFATLVDEVGTPASPNAATASFSAALRLVAVATAAVSLTMLLLVVV